MTPAKQSPIRTILWDLGGVLFDVDLDRSRARWADMTGLSQETFDTAFFESGAWHRLELGQMKAHDAVGAVNGVLDTDVSYREFCAIWNAAIQPRPDHIELLRTIRSKVHHHVISNTDPIHAAWVRQHPVLSSVVETWTFSCEVGVEKPDELIYRRALDGMGVQAGRVLFIDDRPENVEGAKALGMAALLYADLQSLRWQVADTSPSC